MLRLYPLLILAISLFCGCVVLNLLEEESVYTCSGIEYNPSYQICENGVLRIQCTIDSYYNPIKEFCSEDNKIHDKCGGKSYNTENQICKNARVYDVCADSIINSNIEGCCNNITFALATQFCFHANDSIYDKCDDKKYNPLYQICEGGILKLICGNLDVLYDPETQFCDANIVYDKCGDIEYNPLNQTCEDNIVFLKCEDKWYDPSLAYCVNNIVKEKETFIDDRDGREYKYIIIGEQTWMAENLQYETSNIKCYNDNPDHCEIYGILYDWNAANIACPLGWHLPSEEEWNTLIAFAGVTSNLLHGRGMDYFGFTALLHGFYISENVYILGGAAFWTVITGSVNWPGYFFLSEYNVKLHGLYVDGSWANVRCIKD